MGILLDDREIIQLIVEWHKEANKSNPSEKLDVADLAISTRKAQLKKVKDYGSTKCPHSSRGNLLRKECLWCWQALLKEIE